MADPTTPAPMGKGRRQTKDATTSGGRTDPVRGNVSRIVH